MKNSSRRSLSFARAQQAAELGQYAGILPELPHSLPEVFPRSGRFASLGVLPHRRKLINRDFQSASELLQGLDGRDGVPVFNTGNVATKQSVLFSISPCDNFFCSRNARKRSPINHVCKSLHLKKQSGDRGE